MIAMAAPVLLERIRAAYAGRLLLMKGFEVATCYRHPSDRLFRDLDLLADDPPRAQAALLAAGFVEVGDPSAYEKDQHLCPLMWPDLPMIIELHREPNRPPWLPRVSGAETFAHAVPSATGVDGLLAPSPPAHALLLVAHAWAHQPLGRLADLLDVAAVLQDDGDQRAGELAARWRWQGIWSVAQSAVDAVFGDHPGPGALTVWARHLATARERTVLENHIARFAGPLSALPARRAPVGLATVIRGTAARRSDEPWANKLRRSGLALAHAFMDKSSHEQTLTVNGRGSQ